MKISEDEFREKQLDALKAIRLMANEVAPRSHGRVYALFGLIAELGKSHQYCDSRYVCEKLNMIFENERFRIEWLEDSE